MGNNLNFNLDVYSPPKPSSSTKPIVSNLVYYDIPDYHGKNTFISNGSRDNAETVDLNSFTEEETSGKNETGANLGDVCLSFVGSFVGEFLNLGEGFVDSHIYGTTKTINATYLDKAFGWENGYDDNIIGYDVSGIVKGAIQGDSQDKKDNWWVEKADGVGEMLGTGLGYMALSSIPFVGILATTFAGAGKQTEKSINTQMAETGCVNDWNVFFRSLGGSLEGFAAGKISNAAKGKSINFKNMPNGVKAMFQKGFIKENIKAVPKILTSSGKSALKDYKVWTETAGKMVNSFVSIFEGKFPNSDELVYGKFLKDLGISAAEFVADFK